MHLLQGWLQYKMPISCAHSQRLLSAAGIEWLRDKFKAYVILRDRLLSDTSILRDKLDVAAPEVASGQASASSNGGERCLLLFIGYCLLLLHRSCGIVSQTHAA